METTRDQLAEALYQKGFALAEIESLKVLLIVSVACFQKFCQNIFVNKEIQELLLFLWKFLLD